MKAWHWRLCSNWAAVCRFGPIEWAVLWIVGYRARVVGRWDHDAGQWRARTYKINPP